MEVNFVATKNIPMQIFKEIKEVMPSDVLCDA